MFLSALLLCSSIEPTLCTLLEDTRGPYATEDLCIARVAEMNSSIYNSEILRDQVLTTLKNPPNVLVMARCTDLNAIPEINYKDEKDYI